MKFMLTFQRKFKLVKRRELTPPVAMKFFYSLKWVSVGSKSTNTKNINKTSNIFVKTSKKLYYIEEYLLSFVMYRRPD